LKYLVWLVLWIAGHATGGVLFGAALGGLGNLVPLTSAAQCVIIGGLCLLGALFEFGWMTYPLPHCRRQVSRLWMLRYPWSFVAFGYGIQLGCGVATRIKHATFFVVLGCALLSGSAAAGATIVGLFGVVRSLPAALSGPWLVSPLDALAWSQALEPYTRLVHRANGVALLASVTILFLNVFEQLYF
jgi:hypothetical protein